MAGRRSISSSGDHSPQQQPSPSSSATHGPTPTVIRVPSTVRFVFRSSMLVRRSSPADLHARSAASTVLRRLLRRAVGTASRWCNSRRHCCCWWGVSLADSRCLHDRVVFSRRSFLRRRLRRKWRRLHGGQRAPRKSGQRRLLPPMLASSTATTLWRIADAQGHLI